MTCSLPVAERCLAIFPVLSNDRSAWVRSVLGMHLKVL
jgi:hypothetical protein